MTVATVPGPDELRERVARLVRFAATLGRWRGKPWGVVVAERTEGLDAEERLTATTTALDHIEAWSDTTNGQANVAAAWRALPPRDDRAAWAALELATIMIDRFDPLDPVPVGGAALVA